MAKGISEVIEPSGSDQVVDQENIHGIDTQNFQYFGQDRNAVEVFQMEGADQQGKQSFPDRQKRSAPDVEPGIEKTDDQEEFIALSAKDLADLPRNG